MNIQMSELVMSSPHNLSTHFIIHEILTKISFISSYENVKAYALYPPKINENIHVLFWYILGGYKAYAFTCIIAEKNENLSKFHVIEYI